MKTIYVCSTTPFAGKTLTTLMLGDYLREKGTSFTYRKPVGNRPTMIEGTLVDDDALFVARTLNLTISPSELSSVLLTQDVLVKALRGETGGFFHQILDFCKQAGEKDEFLLLGGYGSLYSGTFLGISGLTLAKSLHARVVLVVRYEGEDVLDYVLKAAEDLEDLLLGVIFNDISPADFPNYNDLIRPFLEKRGISILGEFPHDDLLAAVSVGELREYLGAKLLGNTGEDRLVEHFLIGGMQVDKAIQYFRKTPNFGVIVGGDRSDIQLAAIETGAICLILTGGLYPNEIILTRAEEAGIPVLVLPEDTYSVARKVEHLPLQTRIRHPRKVQRARELGRTYLRKELLDQLLS
ncbi:phosphotransacetylase family protein [Thermosulfurimonas sp. F29]|uniref:phosphotransacetylase family protein n=1 Tax=Thermosulfurimonas sp. F29 TaxID=2867247 RepID=UPI001C834778|nr:phosphotransacetylase family protein [Thermosulfurimonas sp. F29]MBX6422795.1 phosphotransacetylase family protein [Thermosulfurimonas sp. F29]